MAKRLFDAFHHESQCGHVRASNLVTCLVFLREIFISLHRKRICKLWRRKTRPGQHQPIALYLYSWCTSQNLPPSEFSFPFLNSCYSLHQNMKLTVTSLTLFMSSVITIYLSIYLPCLLLSNYLFSLLLSIYQSIYLS